MQGLNILRRSLFLNIHHKPIDIRERVINWLDVERAKGFEWKGKLYQIDRDSVEAMNNKVLRVSIGSKLRKRPRTVQWRATDNTDQTFTRHEFIEFVFAVHDYVEELIIKGRKLKE
jgi:hypothetical protein